MLLSGVSFILVIAFSTLSYFHESVYQAMNMDMYYHVFTVMSYAFCVMFGYILNIYIGSNHWSMTNVEDMYMIKLNDFYGSKVIFIQKNLRANKTIKFNYNLNTYTMMKRVNVPLTDNVKKVLDFIKED